jgi:hypothetical protein
MSAAAHRYWKIISASKMNGGYYIALSGAAHNYRWIPINHPVPYPASRVVFSVTGADYPSAQATFELRI